MAQTSPCCEITFPIQSYLPQPYIQSRSHPSRSINDLSNQKNKKRKIHSTSSDCIGATAVVASCCASSAPCEAAPLPRPAAAPPSWPRVAGRCTFAASPTAATPPRVAGCFAFVFVARRRLLHLRQISTMLAFSMSHFILAATILVLSSFLYSLWGLGRGQGPVGVGGGGSFSPEDGTGAGGEG